jgi:5,10-methenyltetrahydrofolate synthetase
MHGRCERGTRIALPVALAHGQPLTFREWRPGARLAHGLWKIPYPAEGAQVAPTVVLAPVVGFDRQGYRLGYGGGFFDRTLAVLRPRPLVIGLLSQRTGTIFPAARHTDGLDCCRRFYNSRAALRPLERLFWRQQTQPHVEMPSCRRT